MYKLKSNRDGSFSLEGAPNQDIALQGINIRFPEGISHAGGKTYTYVAGPPTVTIIIRHPSGDEETVDGVAVEW